MKLWLAFAIGMAIHIGARANGAVSSPLNSLNTYRLWIAHFWGAIAVRIAVLVAILGVWMEYPGLSNVIQGWLGLGDDWKIPIIWPVTLLLGLLGDLLLDLALPKIPVLGPMLVQALPPAGDSVEFSRKTTTQTDSVTVTKAPVDQSAVTK